MHLLRFEEAIWATGILRVAGADEAGRGPLAGPVVVAAVSLPESSAKRLSKNPLITDSKTLSEKKRELAFDHITQLSDLSSSIAVIDAKRIDEINILQATHEGFRQVLADISPAPDTALIDGRPIPDLPCPAQNIIKGDAKSLLIGAASILAKVTRDRLMKDYALRWPEYGFEQHKGYGTVQHLNALKEHGPCPIHRQSFRPVAEAQR